MNSEFTNDDFVPLHIQLAWWHLNHEDHLEVIYALANEVFKVYSLVTRHYLCLLLVHTHVQWVV